ncbi:conserved hypothetical protein [Uncinocarpus reesii 1704]|uniref:Hexokinase n=1 Tax=Uncinocarpus reesii (strain UAMH 1704) TaxID=336963 RepID=C4JJ28_UNCRE|nr:uncharacterized protein UREG_01635 [Uncinocarpus reesii 1704]EEP76786.1 conserved hypothetical protein [Uncinocarpus reesii 1704]
MSSSKGYLPAKAWMIVDSAACLELEAWGQDGGLDSTYRPRAFGVESAIIVIEACHQLRGTLCIKHSTSLRELSRLLCVKYKRSQEWYPELKRYAPKRACHTLITGCCAGCLVCQFGPFAVYGQYSAFTAPRTASFQHHRCLAVSTSNVTLPRREHSNVVKKANDDGCCSALSSPTPKSPSARLRSKFTALDTTLFLALHFALGDSSHSFPRKDIVDSDVSLFTRIRQILNRNLATVVMGDSLVKAAHQLQKFFSHLVQIIHKLLNGSFRGEATGKRRRFNKRRRSLKDFAQEVEQLFIGHLSTGRLASMSKEIRSQLRSSAQSSHINMLPSFSHSLPSGNEKGTYLALDVGGSTLRVALVELLGKNGEMKILRIASSHINEDVKALMGKAFFDWMAGKIEEMLQNGTEDHGKDSSPLPMGLSWSFPIEQTSIRSGNVIAMGKGFRCSDGTVGDDLRELIMEACQKRNLNVTLEAIVNDGSATLLSRAYVDPTTRLSLILGTGTNMSVHFPVHAIGIEKYGKRSPEWFAQADHVITNTEISMFGGGVLQMTRWDDDLNRNHIKPDYQPLEYMCTGRYLGEIVRLIAVEAVQTAGLFGGHLPASMQARYSLDTADIACIEEDTSPSFKQSLDLIQEHHQFRIPPTPADIAFLKTISHCVSQRATAYLAVAIHGLWCLRNESETPILPATPESMNDDSNVKPHRKEYPKDPVRLQVNIACDGSVINKYPNFRTRCQNYLNQLTLEPDPPQSISPTDDVVVMKEPTSSVDQLPSITLDSAPESGIFGAAVAVAVAAPGNE